MAWTPTDLDIIERAIAGPELRVRFKEREVEYRSMDEMLKARDVIRASLTSGRVKTTLATFSKG